MISLDMDNPWKTIELSDYENHMSLGSVMQLQAMNSIMRDQFEVYDVHSVMVLGVAGGNGLEHVSTEKYHVVYGVDINEDYLRVVENRYPGLSGVLKCLQIDLINECDKLPCADFVIANLLIEYIGYKEFQRVIAKIKPKFVSCVIQINADDGQWISDSPYLHAFDRLDEVHCQMEEDELEKCMNDIGYRKSLKSSTPLPNGKMLLRLDFVVA